VTLPAADPDAEGRRLRAALDEARGQLVEAEREVRALRAQLARVHGSVAGQLAIRLQAMARRATPTGSRRQRWLHRAGMSVLVLVDAGPRGLMRERRRAGRLLVALSNDLAETERREYTTWVAERSPSPSRLEAMRAEVAAFTSVPLISVLMPVKDPHVSWLREAAESVLDQVYPHLELCIADDASTSPGVRELISRLAGEDERVRVVRRDVTGGISAATNTALGLASGEYVCVVDHDDVLRPHALFSFARYLQDHPDADIVYADEDVLLPSGEFGRPRFKPDYSPDLLLSHNYITHPVLLKRSLLVALEGFRTELDGSQDHDLLLRAMEYPVEVGHIADVLYAWRSVEGSTAMSADYKPLAREAGRRAVEEALRRRGCVAKVGFGPEPGTYTRRYSVANAPSVSILVCTCRHRPLSRRCIESIEEITEYRDYSVTVVDGCNRSALVNRAVADVDSDHLLVLSGGIVVTTPGWLEGLLELSERMDIGAVGARLLDRQGRVRHSGIMLGRLQLATIVDMGWPVIREVSAVSGACLMTRRRVFDEIGGFDERLTAALEDVDYCMRARQGGYRVLCTPHSELVNHHAARDESAGIPDDDRRLFAERWGDVDEIVDPYVNVNVLQPNPLRLRLDTRARSGSLPGRVATGVAALPSGDRLR
jgi:GT2 family glycosyltransferase